MTTNFNAFIISDSSGATAMSIARTAVAQFPEANANFKRYPFIQTQSMLDGILKLAKEQDAIIFHTLVDPDLSKLVTAFAMDNNLYSFDCIQKPIQIISKKLHESAAEVPGLVHNLNEDYFKRISAIEFAVANDDGKRPGDLKKADIVLLGISRTSKTPLSLYLANQNLLVANVPIGPTIQLPEEVYQIDHNKIFGLTNSVTNLKKIRQERMIAYGLDPDTPYSDSKQIKKELDYAKHLYRKLDCLQINVYNKSIEETATIITQSLNINEQGH
ncbi:pyruvate, water dikinase regulatory protein [Fructilactobacillus fructivorans]|uniref:Putative pyruvate, phosphate dikinase regulatory protein n=1 Tax=Fructilactobacillus fructivorans TaxID=1614 RepID=A0AAE6P1L9_9LACO|nr:pyruvate, water dikinase regulatory protein [Fructilactobacillus fructivorans]KRK58701.1 PEP synthetase regulatory protein [Fructilactobacillus fructivorans]KRN40255.1 PEP synthetase regulatory protein [Fructilactobacillus fructivorans]QFX92703.1 pyruvate, phosphate dikinase/phosphoenolpyruvate synthase regulator [Fructilactobacillus fructivorans]RDV65704.1 kinase/pyrophosphorylase [Fructilactobacillus fructivorans]